MTQDPLWTLTHLGYEITYPRNKTAHMLMRAEILANDRYFTPYERRLAQVAYKTPVTRKASQSSLKEKLIKAVYVTEAEKGAKEIKPQAKKGLKKMASEAGLKTASDFASYAEKVVVDKEDPLYKMIKDRLSGSSKHTDYANLFGLTCDLISKKDFAKASKLLGIEEETLLIYLASEGGAKDPRIHLYEALKKNKGRRASQRFAVDAPPIPVVKDMATELVPDFPSFNAMIKSLKFVDFFSKKAYQEIIGYFKDAYHWFDYTEMPDFEITSPIDSTSKMMKVTYWNVIKWIPKTIGNFIVTMPERLCALFARAQKEGWIAVFSDVGLSFFIFSLIGYYVFVGLCHLGLWLSELPFKIMFEWPVKALWWIIKKIILGAYTLGKYAYKFITEEDVRVGIVQYLQEVFLSKKDYMRDPDELIEAWSGDEEDVDVEDAVTSKNLEKEYLSDPDKLLDQMV